MKRNNSKKAKAKILIAEASGLFLGLFAMVCLVFTSILCYADNGKAISLNDAVDDGLVRIVDSKSRGGYSRFSIELENTGGKPVSIDPYGSAFDPPSGVRTQRVGIGLPLKIGDKRIDMRKKLSTDPSQEAPVGDAANQNSSGSIPDGALPAAAGAAAAAAAVGTALTGMAQGVRPKEAINDLVGLIQGEGEPVAADIQPPSDFDYQTGIIKSYRDQDMTELDYQKQRLQAAKAQGAEDVVRDAEAAVGRLTKQIDNYDKNLDELGLKPLEHTEMEQRTFDYTRKDIGEEVKAELAADAAGTLTDMQQVKIYDNIDLEAPDEDTAEIMKSLVDKMTVETGDGKTLGNFRDIMSEIIDVAQQSRQPDLTYLQRYSIRDEIQEGARLYGSARGYAQDATGTISGLADENVRIIDQATKLGKAAPYLDAAGKISEFAGYVAGYKATGDSSAYATVKAVTQLGVKQVAFKNPVVGIADTVVKYVSQATLGREATASKAAEFLTNTVFDATTGDKVPVHFNNTTGQYEMGTAVVNIDSPEMTERAANSLLPSIEEQLKNTNLPIADRQDLLSKHQELLDTLGKTKGG